ncbi:DUF3592 domain-containing protein [Streptomyces sp. NPDC004065]|uniref:DUF3592 domain-containing protein n=1 Tax=Streptomyces sp. NPDC004065 TaxID=3364689 RepID=UPI00384C6058
MDKRGSVPGGDEDGRRPAVGWWTLAVAAAAAVWVAFGPFRPVWLYLLCWAVPPAAADGIAWLVRRHGPARRDSGRLSAPPRLVAGWPRPGPGSWLVAPGWARARLAAAGFLLFATLAGVMAWQAGREYRTLADLRDHGRRTDATVVEVTGRSEEGWATSVTVRFGTPSGPVRADVDVPPGPDGDTGPGTRLPVVYDPAHPTEVRQAVYLDGRDADGIRMGAIVLGLLATGFLTGTVTEVLRAARRPDLGGAPAARPPGT